MLNSAVIQTIIIIFSIGLSYGIITTQVKNLKDDVKELKNDFRKHLNEHFNGKQK